MTLTIYICLRYIRGLAWSFLGIFFLILLIDGSDQINFMASRNIDLTNAFKSTILRTPSILIDALPLIIMIGGLITFINLSRSSELVVVRSVGKSAIRILYAPLLLTFFIGVFCTFVGNPIVATSIRTSEQFLQNIGLRPRNFLSFTGENIWLREATVNKQTVIKASRSNFEGKILFDLTLFEFDGEDTLTRRITADKGSLGKGNLKLENVVIWTLRKDEPIDTAFSFEKTPTLRLKTTLTETQILDSFADPKAIDFWSLPNFIDKLESSGFSAIRHKIFYNAQLARPLFYMAMLLIGAGFAMRQARFGQTGILILLSVSSGFILFSIKRVAESLGAAGEIPVVLATFGPSFSGILLATGLLLHLEDG